jgi:DNA topoisomerase-1
VAATPTPTPISPFTARPVRKSALPLDPCQVADPVEAAKAAGLRYVTDQSPGIRRSKAGRHFRYIAPDGTPVRDQLELARIKALAIPPAWSDVWICSRSDGHLQATGRDAKGRKQYRYHPRWREVRDETKYGRMLAFGQTLPRIRERVEHDLNHTGLPREKVLAAVVRLLERTLIRIGNEEYARVNESYGLTTLRDEHVAVNTTAVHFYFRGKSGKEHQVDLHDRRLAGIVRRCRDLPGQILFQYLDEHGHPHSVGSADVNDYLREIAGEEFTAKDFRTWFGTVLAARELLNAEPAESHHERQHRIVRAVEAVAERLGNTPAICRRCYVHPLVPEAYLDGRLQALAVNFPDDGTEDEQLVMRLLEQNAG